MYIAYSTQRTAVKMYLCDFLLYRCDYSGGGIGYALPNRCAMLRAENQSRMNTDHEHCFCVLVVGSVPFGYVRCCKCAQRRS
jgi:hypothetical protein